MNGVFIRVFLKWCVMLINELREKPTAERARLRSDRVRERQVRQEKMGEQRRAHLLDVAQSMLASEGWDRFNLREMAARAGYSAGALYAYFDSKDALLRAVRARCLQALHLAIDGARLPRSRPAGVASTVDATSWSQPYVVKMQAWWDGMARHPLGVPMLLGLVYRDRAEAGDLLADMETLTAGARATLPVHADQVSMVHAMHTDILVSGLGYLVALGRSPSSAHVSVASRRFAACMRMRLSSFVAGMSGASWGAVSDPNDHQPDLFSFDRD